jgi:hypothetical protein
MSARVRLALLAACAALLAGAAPAHAQTKTGTTIGTFLRIEPDARIAAMGNAGVSFDGGLEGFYFNPASLARSRRHEVAFTHNAWIADIAFDHVAAAFPLGKSSTIVATVTSLRSGDILVRTVDQPLGTGELYSVSDLALGVGWARPVTDRFSVGAQLSYLQERVWNSTLSSAVLALGTLYRTSENGLVLGASLSNLGTGGGFSGRDLGVTFDQDPNANGDNGTIPAEILTEKFGVPVLLRFGIALPYKINGTQKLRVEVDALHPSDNSESLNLGAEYSYRDRFALRAGWQSLLQKDAEGGLTLGAGWTGEMNNSFGYDFAYAFADQGRLGSVHRVTVGVDF